MDSSRDAALADPATRPRVARFVRCLASFKSRLPETTEFVTASARPQQRALERALACATDAPNAATLAAEYAASATILYEWEGLHTAPLEEAGYAERFIREHPTSPLVPYLHLFVAARMRYAFEMLDGALVDQEMVSLARRYVAHLEQGGARSPLLRLIGADLDGLAFVYKDVGKHPREVMR